MKVLEVISSLEPIGGGETFAVNISRSFHKKHELKVVILYQKHTKMFIDRLDEAGIDYVFLNKKKHFDLKNARELRKIISDFKPDYIHTENNALIPTYLALRKLPSKRRPPVFHTMHLAPSIECSQRIVRVLYTHIFKTGIATPVAITESLAKESEDFYKLNNIPYVENGIDLSRIPTETIPLKKRNYDLVVVGRFSYPKNHEFLIRTFREIKSKKPDFKPAFIGGGELFEQMKQLAIDLNCQFIEFLGTMPNPATILINTKIIALGSRFEANPLSLLEGMASGCIAVSSNVGGVGNIVKKDNGFLFELNNSNRFIEIVLEILNNLSNFEDMSKHNIEYAHRFSMDKCADKYIKLLK